MKIEYLRTAKHSYMIVREVDFAFENYEVQMILHNEISVLLKMQIIVGDGRMEYWYDVTGMQSLEKQISLASVNEDRLRRLLLSLCDMKAQMEEYMLDDRNINFSSAMIFCDRNDNQFRFCYIPGYIHMEEAGIRGLLEEILQHLDHTDSGAVRIGYEMYENCVRTEFLVSDCRRCLNQVQEEDLSMLTEPDEEDLDFYMEESMEIPIESKRTKTRMWRRKSQKKGGLKNEELKEKRLKKKKIKKKQSYRQKYDFWEDVGEELDFESDQDQEDLDQTVCFSQEQTEQVWELSYRGDGLEENFRICKLPFLIGKEEDKVDGKLHAQTVSRVHACFSGDESGLYLEDYNSTNGTYLNGKLIPMNTPMPVQKGDRIVFATEEYILIDRKIPKC